MTKCFLAITNEAGVTSGQDGSLFILQKKRDIDAKKHQCPAIVELPA
jgi:hypothetical protein